MSNRVAARRIQQHRIRLAMSPEQYGVHVGLSGMTVRRVESGYVPFRDTQGKFAKALGVEVDDLFPGVDRWTISRRRKEPVTA